VSFYLGYFALNWIFLPLLVEVVRIPPIIAQTAFQLIAILGGYLWHSRVTFAQKERAGSR
jgi:putative flippase GtrA